MLEPIKYLQLAWLILTRGQMKHSGEDFNKNRMESLQELQEFVPGRTTMLNPETSSRNATTRTIVAQSAFFKNSLKTQGGHLTVGDLNYIRIPKAASTSMSNALLEKRYPALKQKSLTETQINFLTDLNLQTDVSSPSSLFTIVRNPFARLVSVYQDLFENPEHYVYRDYLFGILPPQLSFSEFVDRISRIPDRLKDQHLKPQHAFLKFYERKNVTVRIFKLEDPELLNQFLKGFSMGLPHLNKSSESYDYSSYYNPTVLTKALEIYRVDVKLFGYEKEYQMLLESVKKDRKTVH